MASQELRKASDAVDDAYRAYATANGDGFSDHNWRGAYEAREDGYAIAEEAFALPVEEREDHIENAVEGLPTSEQEMVSASAYYRLIELVEVGAPKMARAA